MWMSGNIRGSSLLQTHARCGVPCVTVLCHNPSPPPRSCSMREDVRLFVSSRAGPAPSLPIAHKPSSNTCCISCSVWSEWQFASIVIGTSSGNIRPLSYSPAIPVQSLDRPPGGLVGNYVAKSSRGSKKDGKGTAIGKGLRLGSGALSNFQIGARATALETRAMAEDASIPLGLVGIIW